MKINKTFCGGDAHAQLPSIHDFMNAKVKNVTQFGWAENSFINSIIQDFELWAILTANIFLPPFLLCLRQSVIRQQSKTAVGTHNPLPPSRKLSIDKNRFLKNHCNRFDMCLGCAHIISGTRTVSLVRLVFATCVWHWSMRCWINTNSECHNHLRHRKIAEPTATMWRHRTKKRNSMNFYIYLFTPKKNMFFVWINKHPTCPHRPVEWNIGEKGKKNSTLDAEYVTSWSWTTAICLQKSSNSSIF